MAKEGIGHVLDIKMIWFYVCGRWYQLKDQTRTWVLFFDILYIYSSTNNELRSQAKHGDKYTFPSYAVNILNVSLF